jgi:hypothetical protein
MNSRVVNRVLVCIVCVAVVVAAGGFAYYWFLIRGPLAGDTSHDFGEVVVTGVKADVSHTFQLFNRTDRVLTIDRVIPECGCVQVSPANAVVEPGKTFDLLATLSVSANGTKTTPIRLIMSDGKVQFLHVTATGRRVESAAPIQNASETGNKLPMPTERPDPSRIQLESPTERPN